MNSHSVDFFDGILLVDKPSGITSHDVVDQIRRRFRFKKTGHGGTLDPQATGLLVILLGRGTKISQYLMSGDKTYEGTIHLGSVTDSQDADGQVIREADASGITRAQLESAFASFRGDLHQIPPMVSAVKKAGVPLYKLARKGEEVEREPKLIHIYEFRMVDFTPPDARFVVRCTKGTYVRTLCHDIGEQLGCGAHLKQLRRTQSGPFNINKATPLADLLNLTPLELMQKSVPLHEFHQFLQPPSGPTRTP
jgi:tRNA pseudouridine55 synthase